MSLMRAAKAVFYSVTERVRVSQQFDIQVQYSYIFKPTTTINHYTPFVVGTISYKCLSSKIFFCGFSVGLRRRQWIRVHIAFEQSPMNTIQTRTTDTPATHTVAMSHPRSVPS